MNPAPERCHESIGSNRRTTTSFGKSSDECYHPVNLTHVQLAEILGLDPLSMAQLEALPELDPHTETGQRAMFLVQIFKRLFAMTGGDAVWMQQFIHTRNQVSNGIPVEQMKSLDGMKNILAFLNMQ